MPTASRARPSPYEVAKAIIAEVERRRSEFLYNVHASRSLIAVSGKRLRAMAEAFGAVWSPLIVFYFLAEAEARGWRLVSTISRRKRGTIWLFLLPLQQPPNQQAEAGVSDASGGSS